MTIWFCSSWQHSLAYHIIFNIKRQCQWQSLTMVARGRISVKGRNSSRNSNAKTTLLPWNKDLSANAATGAYTISVNSPRKGISSEDVPTISIMRQRMSFLTSGVMPGAWLYRMVGVVAKLKKVIRVWGSKSNESSDHLTYIYRSLKIEHDKY